MFLAIWLQFFASSVLVLEAHAATRSYAAETVSKKAREEGLIKVGGRTWNCKGNYCEMTDLSPQSMDVSSCAALAGRVGPIGYFGLKDKTRYLNRRQLNDCNGASRFIEAPDASDGATEAEPLDEFNERIPVPIRSRSPQAGGGQNDPPPLDAQISTKATSYDLAVVDVMLTDKAAMFPHVEGARVHARVTVQNTYGLAPSFLVSTTGDSSTSDRLIKSAETRLGAGRNVVLPLELYINPAHVEDGVFHALVWLGTPETPLVYADADRDNNIREIKFPIKARPRQPDRRPPPRTTGTGSRGSSDGEGDGCVEERIGQTCRVRPDECSGRGKDWTVEGTYRCVGGEMRCEARAQEDYCTSCGGVCGACANSSCSATNLCAPGATCVDNPAMASRPFCQDLNVDYVARRIGRPVCTRIVGFCWTPNETGRPHIICREAEGWDSEDE